MSQSKERLLYLLRQSAGPRYFDRVQKLIREMEEADAEAMMHTVDRAITNAKMEGKNQAMRQVRRGGMAALHRR